jgi:preprotein translocase subunit SecA
MFKAMLDGIKEESVGFLFNLEVKSADEQEAEAAAKQAEAEAAALAAAQEGTARVLARQAAEAQAAAAAKAAPVAQPKATARKSAAQTPVAQAPTPSGTGPQLAVKGLDEPRPAENLQYSAPTLDASPKESGAAKAAKSATVTGTKETPRNAPCPCGSGKKYKQCHGAAGR